jgi:hypothetical protein
MKFSTFKKLHHTLWGRIAIALFSFFLIIFLFLFTPWGNLALKPLLEERLSRLSGTQVIVSELSLHYNKFHILCRDTLSNTQIVHGGFSLLTLRMYGHYHLHFAQTGGLNPLPFTWETSGALSGGITAFDIIGRAKLARGDALYHLQLHRFALSMIDLKIDALSIEPLIHLMKYPSDTDATLNATIHLSGIDTRDIAGKISLETRTSRFTATEIVEDNTTESFSLAKLLSDKYGVVKPFKINLTTDISLDEAGAMEQLAGIPLRGKADVSGVIRGDEKELTVHAHSPIAGGNTSSTVIYKNLEPSKISLHTQHADIGSLFRFLAFKPPLEGKLEMQSDLTGHGGLITLKLTNASTVPQVLKDEYNLTQPKTRFNALLTADLDKSNVHYRGIFKSDLSRMEIDNTTTRDQMLRELLKSLR